jgi:predicted DCC family thiol-disulfide oxidoreductase YuxK
MIEQQTNRYTLLYDGNCRMCTAQARLVESYNDGGLIELLDMNSAAAQSRFPQVSPADAQRELHLVAPDGSLNRGAVAVRETLLRLPALRGLGELLRIPGAIQLAQPIYAFVARNRYLFGGNAAHCDDGSCALKNEKRENSP